MMKTIKELYDAVKMLVRAKLIDSFDAMEINRRIVELKEKRKN